MVSPAAIHASRLYREKARLSPLSYSPSIKIKAARVDARLQIRENPRCSLKHTVRSFLDRAGRICSMISTRQAADISKGRNGNDDLEFMAILA
jgi:hypothetical protein